MNFGLVVVLVECPPPYNIYKHVSLCAFFFYTSHQQILSMILSQCEKNISSDSQLGVVSPSFQMYLNKNCQYYA